MAAYAYLPIKTREECICEMKSFALSIVKNSKINKISLLVTNNKLTVLNKIFHLLNDLMLLRLSSSSNLLLALPDLKKNKLYSFINKIIRDIKFMSYVDTSENINYIYNELCLFLEINSKNLEYSIKPIKMEIDRILAIQE